MTLGFTVKMKPESHGTSFIKNVLERLWASVKKVRYFAIFSEMSSPSDPEIATDSLAKARFCCLQVCGTVNIGPHYHRTDRLASARFCCPVFSTLTIGIGTHYHYYYTDRYKNRERTIQKIVEQPSYSGMASRVLPPPPNEGMVSSVTYQDISPPQQLSGPVTLNQNYSGAFSTTGPLPGASGNQYQCALLGKNDTQT